MLLAALVLTAAAWLRGAEYDEQYTLFLTAGTARPDWPETVFPAGTVAALQTGHASFNGIAHDLLTTDVHPPFYFWAVAGWRLLFGPTLFAARMLSVLFGVASIGLVGLIARQCGIRPVPAMLLTLGCYGFVFTNAVARGFAPAEALTLAGVALLLSRRPLLAGVCFGAACCCNYLAVFVAVAAVAAGRGWRAVPSGIPFAALDAWFFAAQHASRTGQFPPFALWPSLLRLAEYQVAAIFGALPLYVEGIARIAVGATVALVTMGLVVLVATAPVVRVLLAAAVAPAVGLLALGAVFDSTPIELRYLSFGLPFVGLLAAGRAVSGAPLRGGGPALTRRSHQFAALSILVILTIQTASIAGLLLSPQTTQPARAAARDAVRLVGDGVVLLPRGNDGVGIVGAFGIEATPNLPILLLRPTDPIEERIAPYRRVALASLAQDADSIATIAALHAALIAPHWRQVATGTHIQVYERTTSLETGLQPLHR